MAGLHLRRAKLVHVGIRRTVAAALCACALSGLSAGRAAASDCGARQQQIVASTADTENLGCDLHLGTGDLITATLLIAQSDISISCTGAAKISDVVISGPVQDVVISGCEISGRVDVKPTNPFPSSVVASSTLWNTLDTMAPHDILFDDVTFTGSTTSLYLHNGAYRVTVLDSEFRAESRDPMVYLSKETHHNVFRRNTFLNESGANDRRELVALDGSGFNEFIGNLFVGLPKGGFRLYRNCGERGRIRHLSPSFNVFSQNYFEYTTVPNAAEQAAVRISTRHNHQTCTNPDKGHSSWCDEDLCAGQSCDSSPCPSGFVCKERSPYCEMYDGCRNLASLLESTSPCIADDDSCPSATPACSGDEAYCECSYVPSSADLEGVCGSGASSDPPARICIPDGNNSALSNRDHARYNVVADNTYFVDATVSIDVFDVAISAKNYNHGNFIKRNERVYQQMTEPQSSPLDCWVGGLGRTPELVPHGSLAWHVSWERDEHPSVSVVVCDDGERITLYDGYVLTTAQPVDGGISGDDHGYEAERSCPSGTVLFGAKLACNLENPHLSAQDFEDVRPGKVRVVTESSNATDGSCRVGLSDVATGEHRVRLDPSSSSVTFHCSEHDSNGGDCWMRGEVYCLGYP